MQIFFLCCLNIAIRRRILSIHLNALHKTLGLMRKLGWMELEIEKLKTSGNSEELSKRIKESQNMKQKIQAEEMKILKFIRDEETKKQKLEAKKKREKEKEESKKLKIEEAMKAKEEKRLKKIEEEKKKKPKVTLNRFFQASAKKTPTKGMVVACKNANVEQKIDRELKSVSHHVSTSVLLDKALASFVQGRQNYFAKKASMKQLKFSNLMKDEVEVIPTTVESEKQPTKLAFGEAKAIDSAEILKCFQARKKLFQFFEDNRPPYFGTFRKRSTHVRNGRKPFAKLDNVDYEYDSADEWEDVEDGESLASKENEDDEFENGENNDALDYKDGWLAAENEVDYDSSVEDPDKFSDMYVKANVHVRNIVGVVFLSDLPGAQASVSKKQVEVLTNFRVEGLAALPLKVPTSDDIKQELIPKQRKPRKSNSGATPKKAKSTLR